MRKLIFLLLLLPLSLFSTGLVSEMKHNNIEFTTNSIEGQIIDEVTNETLAGVTIEFYVDDEIVGRTYTDFEGNFKFDIEKDKQYEVKISFISYKTEYILIEDKKVLTLVH